MVINSHFLTFCAQKNRKIKFLDEEFFGMSSYTFENFQLFILYNFQFHHMVLKRLPEDLNSFFDFFWGGVVFFLVVLSWFFSKLLYSWYIRRKVEKRLSDSYSLFEFSSPFFVFLPFLLKQSMKIFSFHSHFQPFS